MISNTRSISHELAGHWTIVINHPTYYISASSVYSSPWYIETSEAAGGEVPRPEGSSTTSSSNNKQQQTAASSIMVRHYHCCYNNNQQRRCAALCFIWFLLGGMMMVMASPDFDNDEIAQNNLGMMSKSCAKFCREGVNGLDLWISLEEMSQRDVRSFEQESVCFCQEVLVLSWYYVHNINIILRSIICRSMIICPSIILIVLFFRRSTHSVMFQLRLFFGAEVRAVTR